MLWCSRRQPGTLPYTTCWRAVGGAGGTTTRHRPVEDTLKNQRAGPGRPRRLCRSTPRPVRHCTGQQQSAAAQRQRTRGVRTPTSRPRLRIATIQNSTEAESCPAFTRPLPKRAASLMRPQSHLIHSFTLLEDQERNPVCTTRPCPDQVPQRSLKRSMRPMMRVKERQKRPTRPACIELRHTEQQQGKQQQKRR